VAPSSNAVTIRYLCPWLASHRIILIGIHPLDSSPIPPTRGHVDDSGAFVRSQDPKTPGEHRVNGLIIPSRQFLEGRSQIHSYHIQRSRVLLVLYRLFRGTGVCPYSRRLRRSAFKLPQQIATRVVHSAAPLYLTVQGGEIHPNRVLEIRLS
jgi:hypothetical protein